MTARHLSLAGLLAAAGLILYGLGSAFLYTATHAGPPCSNPPALNANPPQLVVIGICVAAFVVGHLAARLQPVDPQHIAAPAAAASEPEQRRRARQALLIQALVLLFLLEVVALLLFEVVALSSGRWPITYYVRCAYSAAGWPTTLAAAAMTFLLGRWLWLPGRSLADPGA